MNHSLSRPYEPNFMSIVPCWRLPGTKTPLRESSNVMQLFHACSANFTLGTMKGSNLFSQNRREGWGRSMVNIQISKKNTSFDWTWERQAPFCDQPCRRRIKHFLPPRLNFFCWIPNFFTGSQIFIAGSQIFFRQVPDFSCRVPNIFLAASQIVLAPGPKYFSRPVPNISLAQIEDGDVPGPRQLPLGPPSSVLQPFLPALD